MMNTATTTGTGGSTDIGIYHEQQSSFNWQCGLHAVNNIIQQPVYTKERLTRICEQLNVNEDMSVGVRSYHQVPIIGGQYSVNVLIYALEEEQGYTVTWLKKDKSSSSIDWSVYDAMLVNIPSKWTFGFSQHWYAVKQITTNKKTGSSASAWYNLDSKLRQAEVIPDIEAYVMNLVKDGNNTHILLLKKNNNNDGKATDAG